MKRYRNLPSFCITLLARCTPIALMVVAALCFATPAMAKWTDAVYLYPRNCHDGHCKDPIVDGYFDPEGYADGSAAVTQDFDGAGSNGLVRFTVDGDTLYLAISVEGDCRDSGGENALAPIHHLNLFFDTHRTERYPQLEGVDRRLTFDFLCPTSAAPNAGGVTSAEYRGDGASGWMPVDPTSWIAWTFTHGQSMSYPAGDLSKMKYEIEVAVALEPSNPYTAWQPSEPLSTGLLGLGIVFDGSSTQGPHKYSLPNTPDGISATDPSTWIDVHFTRPPSIPVSLKTYNVGLMPFPLKNGGAGHVWQFSWIAANSEFICFDEVWTKTKKRQIFALTSFMRAVLKGTNDQTTWGAGVPGWSLTDNFNPYGEPNTGLVAISDKPIINATEESYQDACYSEDCLESKGFLWARVLTKAGAPVSNSQCTTGGPLAVCPSTGWDAHQYIDVFCTHLQADPTFPGETDETTAAQARFAQIDQLKGRIHEIRVANKGTDRPAFIMGDFNINGNDGAWNNKSPSQYERLLNVMGMDQLSWFDQHNTWLSHRYDLGLYPPNLTTDPGANHKTTPIGDMTQNDNVTPPIPPNQWPFVEPVCTVDGSRYDYILVVPAEDQLPAYGILPDPAPSVTVVPYHLSGTNPNTGACLSDHAAVAGSFQMVETLMPGRWNWRKHHNLIFAVASAYALYDDCFACGDPDMYPEFHYTFGDTDYEGFQYGSIDDSRYDWYPGWQWGTDAFPPGPPSPSPSYGWNWSTRLRMWESNNYPLHDEWKDCADPPGDDSSGKDASHVVDLVGGSWVQMYQGSPRRKIGDLDGTDQLVDGYGGRGSDILASFLLRVEEID